MPKQPSHLTAAEQEGFARRLLALQRQLQGQLQQLRAAHRETSLGEGLQELSTYDNHPADIGTELFQRSRELGALDLLAGRLDQVEEALARVRAGLYGTCSNCGRPIGRERLAAVPETVLCIDCARERAARGPGGAARAGEATRRSASWPALYGAYDDERVAFDQEDAWQAVARYGTSSEEPEGGLEEPGLT
ncbi:MAG TPA: TraR/DksA C4-type zinc finger protein [Sphingobacteriaceae bacterium]|nr:TraR/DksA C4-type zinc finger protein [Sphingobacteriaceae bacterium]